MENNKYDYNPEENYNYDSEDDYNYEQEENEAIKKSLRGYRVIIILLTVVLAGVSIFCFSLYKKQKEDYKELQDKELVLNEMLNDTKDDLNELLIGYDTLRMKNDTLNVQYENAQKMIDQLKNERRLNYNALKKYKNEIESMRKVMKGYLKQIDSLNKTVKVISDENVGLRKKVANESLRANKAEEQAKEAQNLIKQGAELDVRNISITALKTGVNGEERETNGNSVNNADKLCVKFAIGANRLAEPGRRNVYLCLYSPDGYMLSTKELREFNYQGSKLAYTEVREVDYQNKDIEVSIYHANSGFIGGTYKVELYMDDTLIGSADIQMKGGNTKSSNTKGGKSKSKKKK